MNNEPSVVTVNTAQSSLSHVGTTALNETRKGNTDVVPSSSSQMSTSSSTTHDGQEKKAVNIEAHSKPLAPATAGNISTNNVGDSPMTVLRNNAVDNVRYNKNNNNNIPTNTSTANPLVTTQHRINNIAINNNGNSNNSNIHRNNEDTSEVRITNDQQVSCIENIQIILHSTFRTFVFHFVSLTAFMIINGGCNC